MSAHRISPLKALLLALMIVPPIAFVSSIPWLRQQEDGLVFLVTGIAATLTVGSAVVLAILQDRSLDEWQRSNSRFSSQWGWTLGASLIAVLLAWPGVQDLIVSGAALWGDVPNPDRRLVVTTFAFGFMSVVAAQGLCTVLLSIGWVMWKSRAPRDAA